MKYKKILAATAITSAAFVVPVMVEASTPVETDKLFTDQTYKVGEEITAVTELTLDDGTIHQIVEYDWSVTYGGANPTEHSIGTKNKLTLPQHAVFDGSVLTLQVKLDNDAIYTQEVKITKITDKLTFTDKDKINITKGLINQSIQAEFLGIASPPTTIFEKHEWYIIEPGQSRLIAEVKDTVIVIPVEASGKTLRLVSTTTDGKVYSQDLPVKQLEINDLEFDIKLNGGAIDGAPSIAPNDTLSVENLKITGASNEGEILKEQAEISYQWYYKGENDVYSKIPDATGATFTVPDDAFGRNLQNISVSVTVEVPNSGAQEKTTTKFAIKLNHSAATDLIPTIDSLIDKDDLPLIKYKSSTIEEFKTKINDITAIYNGLSANSKNLVTNYSIVEQAIEDLKAVESLIKELDAFTIEKSKYDTNPSEFMHSKLVKQFTAIENKYNNFDSLKRSLLEISADYKGNYMENMAQYLSNITDFEDKVDDPDYITASVVAKINSDISKLFVDTTIGEPRVYSFETFGTREAMLNEIERLEDEIKKVDRVQQAVINSSLLKNAKTDIKKANTVAKKIADIDKKVGAKKVQAILSARVAYKKLTFMQQSLITEDEVKKINEDAYSEDNEIIDLVDAIEELKTDTTYNFSGYNNDMIKDKPFGSAVETLLEKYKGLNSSAKKSISNYNVLNQAKKDISSATRVVNSINKAIDAYEEALLLEGEKYDKALKSVQSKYSSAYKSYIKLSLLQRSIVENTESFSYDKTFADFTTDLENLTDDVFVPKPDQDPDSDPEPEVGFDELVSELIKLDKDVSEGTSAMTPTEILATVKTLEAYYKALNPIDKKKVYNYSVLSNAKSLATKASSVEKTLTTAYNSDSVSKMESALKSYAKLTYGQQEMIDSIYQEVIFKLADLKPDLSDLELALETLKYELSLANILQVQELSQSVDKKELQKLPNYKAYQDALKVQKAVDSFLKKYDKLGTNPTYSKKQSIIKDLNKLTKEQLDYLLISYQSIFGTVKNWEKDMSSTAQEMNEKIATLYDYTNVNQTEALTYLENAVNEMKVSYKELDSKERKLVTHYSYLSKIEKDITAVRRVIEMKDTATEKEILQAYNRLTMQQQVLYSKVTP